MLFTVVVRTGYEDLSRGLIVHLLQCSRDNGSLSCLEAYEYLTCNQRLMGTNSHGTIVAYLSPTSYTLLNFHASLRTQFKL